DELDTQYPFLLPNFVRDVSPGSVSESDYENYLQSLGYEDRAFLEEYRWAMKLEAPVILGGGSEKKRQMKQVILDAMTILLDRAKKGDVDERVQHMSIPNSWTHAFGYSFND